MRIGSADGPGEDRAHKSTHVIYDTRSGHIVATHHFIGAAPSSEQHRVSAAHEGCARDSRKFLSTISRFCPIQTSLTAKAR